MRLNRISKRFGERLVPSVAELCLLVSGCRLSVVDRASTRRKVCWRCVQRPVGVAGGSAAKPQPCLASPFEGSCGQTAGPGANAGSKKVRTWTARARRLVDSARAWLRSAQFICRKLNSAFSSQQSDRTRGRFWARTSLRQPVSRPQTKTICLMRTQWPWSQRVQGQRGL